MSKELVRKYYQHASCLSIQQKSESPWFPFPLSLRVKVRSWGVEHENTAAERSISLFPSLPPPLKSSFASWTLRIYYFLSYSSHSHLGGLYNLQNCSSLRITMSKLESLCSFVVADCRGGVYQFPPKFSFQTANPPASLAPYYFLLPLRNFPLAAKI